MKNFKRYFYETLRVDDTNARSKLSKHPLVQNGTFGVEIEFKVLGMPVNNWDGRYLAYKLEGTDFEQKLRQQHGSVEDYFHGHVETVKMTDREWKDFLEEYIRNNKEEAVDAWMEEYGDETDGNNWKPITTHWKSVCRQVIVDAGFQVGHDQARGSLWGVGEDGRDTEEQRPVVEIRTGIMTEKDIPAFEKVLLGIQKMIVQNKSYVHVAENTGIHVHVSNDAINKEDEPDPFTRLASIASVDEDKIWDDMASHDRSFERFSLLNRQQDFSSYKDKGFHRLVIEWVWMSLNPDRSKVSAAPKGPTSFTVNVSSAQLAGFMNKFERNVGINTKSRQPTVEYRQLSSALLTEPKGPTKVIDYVRYFMQNTAGLSNKNQIVVKDDDDRVTFTRIQGGARIDFQKRASSDDRFSTVPQSGDKTDVLRGFPPAKVPPWKSNRVGSPSQPPVPPAQQNQAAGDFRRMFDDTED
jgi:hypothetical protein